MCAVLLLLLEKCHVDLSNSVVLFLLFGDELACSLFLILGISLNPILEEIFCVVSVFEGIKFVLEKGKAYWGKRCLKDSHNME
ncbi:MAG: hypothetical protein QNJ70_06435 [Xenococcaceae cyanobacterium MO_207.B15]|nr:hypothetical protein [Xenococcaceae cyanobacterium MO_207.B15]MDJ0746163.1 hypothetical protein [Xenococcaceae cyanobacterium MO_167.B27]